MIPSTPRVLEAIRRHQSSTIGELAAELDLPWSRVCADLGGLHDYGYVTRYGSTEFSRVSWVGPDDLYVRTCVEHATADQHG